MANTENLCQSKLVNQLENFYEPPEKVSLKLTKQH